MASKNTTRESEKWLENNLRERVKKLGGWAIKFVCPSITGMPDRMCLLPGGRIFFAEMKSKGKKPSPRQILVKDKIERLGFKVYVIDNEQTINEILEEC